MSICYEVVCDRCAEGEGSLHIGPKEANDAAKEVGWTRDEETGEDLCPVCNGSKKETPMCKHPEDQQRQQTETHCGLCGEVL